MNIRSLLRAFSFEKTESVQKEQMKEAPASAVSPKGISSFSDSYEPAPKSTNSSFTRDNYFFGKQLDPESLQQEQDYSKPLTESGKSFDAAKKYTGVLLQEGRVQLDSDFHESDDVKHEASIALRDSAAYNSFKDDDDD